MGTSFLACLKTSSAILRFHAGRGMHGMTASSPCMHITYQTHKHTHSYTRSHAHTHTHKHTHTHILTHIRAHTHIRTHARTHTHTHTHIRAHTYTHTPGSPAHTGACAPPPSPPLHVQHAWPPCAHPRAPLRSRAAGWQQQGAH